jgi:hypothetical protein
VNEKKIIKYLGDAIPKGPHPEPHAEWIQVRLDVVQEAIDHIEWVNKGNKEWRDMYQTANAHHRAAQATARIAITHLQAVLGSKTSIGEVREKRDAAKDWLVSIGSDPG